MIAQICSNALALEYSCQTLNAKLSYFLELLQLEKRSLQVFYQEFGSLMMRQPLIGFEFTTYAPLVLVPYIILLVLNVFNRLAAFCLRSPSLLFEDDWETQSPYATSGSRLLNIELENFAAGKPMGLTISPQGDGSCHSAD